MKRIKITACLEDGTVLDIKTIEIPDDHRNIELHSYKSQPSSFPNFSAGELVIGDKVIPYPSDQSICELLEDKQCTCGSGEHPEEVLDGHGIYLFRACDKCKKEKLSHYRSDILEDYISDEQIEPD